MKIHGRADSARKQIKLYQRKCSCIKIKSYSDMNPVNCSWCRSVRFFRWKKVAVDISVNRFYFITNELKMVFQFFSFSYSFIDILFFDIFTLLSLACNSSWEQRLSSKVPFFLWYDALSPLQSFRGHQVLCLNHSFPLEEVLLSGWLHQWDPQSDCLSIYIILNDTPLSVIVTQHSRPSLQDEGDGLFCHIRLSTAIRTCLSAN